MRENCIDCGKPLGEGALIEHGDKCVDCLMQEGIPSKQEMRKLELIEQLADKEHERWSHWMRYLFQICPKHTDGSTCIPPLLVDRWMRQAHTAYANLSEQEKQSDRDEVAKILPIIKAYAKPE